jgi:uncharacterized protein (TIGR02246 family)
MASARVGPEAVQSRMDRGTVLTLSPIDAALTTNVGRSRTRWRKDLPELARAFGAPFGMEIDETRIKEMHSRMIESWNKGSGAGFAAPFAADADFIAFEGSRLKGRAQIAEFHQTLFDTSLKGTRLEGGVHFVRFLNPVLAVMHAWATTTLPGQINASSSRDSMQLFVATKHDDSWQFDSMLNARRITLEQQLFADEFASLSPGDQSAVKHRVATMRH